MAGIQPSDDTALFLHHGWKLLGWIIILDECGFFGLYYFGSFGMEWFS